MGPDGTQSARRSSVFARDLRTSTVAVPPPRGVAFKRKQCCRERNPNNKTLYRDFGAYPENNAGRGPWSPTWEPIVFRVALSGTARAGLSGAARERSVNHASSIMTETKPLDRCIADRLKRTSVLAVAIDMKHSARQEIGLPFQRVAVHPRTASRKGGSAMSKEHEHELQCIDVMSYAAAGSPSSA